VSAPSNRRRRADHGGGHEGGDERWLLTYADMITLLMALFIVMWAISSTNITKFRELKQSLNQAFSGKIIAGNHDILHGGARIMEEGSQGTQGGGQAFFDPAKNIAQSFSKVGEKHETQSLKRLQQKIESYAKTHGFSKLISTKIDERGLVVRLLTDKVLFDSGRAELHPQSLPLIVKISRLLTAGSVLNPVRVEGNTDNQPISSAEFRSNWELSTARANAVLEVLLANGVPPRRLSVAGYADQNPIAVNSSFEGRAKNRRVELVVLRRIAVEGDSQ
jgi:chemotaxis protein MotB